MKQSATYKFISAFLSLSIFLGIAIPTGLHAKSHQTCDEMPATAYMGHEMKSMEHVETHDFGFACTCSVEEAPLQTEAQSQLKVKAPVIAVIQILAETHTDETETISYPVSVSDSYSPPPIYLANESFLN